MESSKFTGRFKYEWERIFVARMLNGRNIK
jgi:hypothetical protein